MLTPAQEGAFRLEAVDLFMGLYDAGEAPDPDAVRAWFAAAGWDDADARELARIAETVGRVLAEHDPARAADAVPAPFGLDTIVACTARMELGHRLVGETRDLLARSSLARHRLRDAADTASAILHHETTRIALVFDTDSDDSIPTVGPTIAALRSIVGQ